MRYKLMDPENFFPFAVPVNDVEEDNLIDGNKGPKKNITPIPLPQEFKESLIKKSSNVDELRELIKSPLIKQAENSSPNANKIGSDVSNEDMENELEAAVQEKFREWLLSSGQLREIADLIGLEKTQKNYIYVREYVILSVMLYFFVPCCSIYIYKSGISKRQGQHVADDGGGGSFCGSSLQSLVPPVKHTLLKGPPC